MAVPKFEMQHLQEENINKQSPDQQAEVIDLVDHKKKNRILEIVDELKNKNWTSEQISNRITEGILKSNPVVSEIKGRPFITDRLRTQLSEVGIEIPNQTVLDELVAEKGMEMVITPDEKNENKNDDAKLAEERAKAERDAKGRELLAQWKKERDAKNKIEYETPAEATFAYTQPANEPRQMKQEQMNQIGTSTELFNKLGTEEKTIITLFSNERNPIAGASRAREYVENTDYLKNAKPQAVENLLNYLANDHDIYKNLIIELKSMLPEKDIADIEYEKFVKNADTEYALIKKLNKNQKLDYETLVELRRANNQMIFNNYLNGLDFNDQKQILPILENREDIKEWIKNWSNTERGKEYQIKSKMIPKKGLGLWGKVKNIFGK